MGQSEIQILVSIVLSYVLQFLKKASWFPMLTERTDKIRRFCLPRDVLPLPFRADSKE